MSRFSVGSFTWLAAIAAGYVNWRSLVRTITHNAAEARDSESDKPKRRVAEADTEMQDLLERAEKALMRVQFPEVCQTADGEYRPDLDDIVERVARVSANYMPRKDAEGLKNAFDALPYDYGTRLRCLLRMVGPYLPDGDTLTEAGTDARDSGDIASRGQAEQHT